MSIDLTRVVGSVSSLWTPTSAALIAFADKALQDANAAGRNAWRLIVD